MSDAIAAAVAALRAGGVIAYPTEAVYGLGCDPSNRAAFDKLFALKQRPAEQGVLLIASDFSQIEKFIDAPPSAIARARATWPGPHTWIFPRSKNSPAWLSGSYTGLPFRVRATAVAVG